MKLAIYDMDRTITRRPSWLPWLLFHARREAPWRLLLLPLAAVPSAGFLLGLVDRRRLKELTHLLLIGRRTEREQLDRTAAAFADWFGPRAELAGALARIAADRADGWEIAIATASSACYARHLAARWGVTHLVATENCTDGRFIFHRIRGDNCYGAAKLAMVRDFVGRLPQAPARTRFYSDHVSDLPTLLLVDEPVAANPSRALRAAAAARGWPVVDWR